MHSASNYLEPTMCQLDSSTKPKWHPLQSLPSRRRTFKQASTSLITERDRSWEGNRRQRVTWMLPEMDQLGSVRTCHLTGDLKVGAGLASCQQEGAGSGKGEEAGGPAVGRGGG